MGFNYSSERKKMDKKYEKMAAICRAEGMTEDQLKELYRFMLDELNSDRRFYTHTQPYDVFDKDKNNHKIRSKKWLEDEGDDIIDEGRSPLLKKFSRQLSVTQGEICEWGRMDWTEDLDTDEIIVWAKAQSDKDIELLTLIMVDGLKQTEVAEMWGVSDSAISKRMKAIHKSIEKILPEWLKMQLGI